jgi:flagellar protein FliO/FliZ
MGMNRAPWLLLLVVVFLFAGACIDVEASDSGITVEEPASIDEGTVLQPRTPAPSMYEDKGSGTGLVWAVYLFFLMVIVLLGLWVYNCKGGLAFKRIGASNELKIRETKPLGNRQFLVVVEYGSQKMLLGVAPGVINHLCYLEDPAESDDPLQD